MLARIVRVEHAVVVVVVVLKGVTAAVVVPIGELAGSSQSCGGPVVLAVARAKVGVFLSGKPSLSSSESQASPSLSKSVLPWPGLLTVAVVPHVRHTTMSVSIRVAGSKPKAIASTAPVGEIIPTLGDAARESADHDRFIAHVDGESNA